MLALVAQAIGCESRTRMSKVGAASATPSEVVQADQASQSPLLNGHFEAVAKRASGSARFAYVAATDTHQLVLERVEVDTLDPVHVYLVSLDEAPNTRAVEVTEDKYDLGEFQAGSILQTFDLPSAPDARLRVVVLWGAKYGINLAQAKLR
jgi:hypothetical protein